MAKTQDQQDIPSGGNPTIEKEDPTFQKIAEKEYREVLDKAFVEHQIEEKTAKQRINEKDPEFLRLYGEKNINNDLKADKAKYGDIRIQNMPIADKTRYEKNELIRLILFEQINNGWFGENVKALIPAKHEELNRNIDLIVEFFDPEKKETSSIIIDVTFYGDEELGRKLFIIREGIRKEVLEKVVYFKTTREEKNDYQDRLRKDAFKQRSAQKKFENEKIFLSVKGMPRFIMGFDDATLAALLNVWGGEGGEDKLKKNVCKLLFTHEILEQIPAFKALVKKFFNSNTEIQKEILNKYDKVFEVIGTIEKTKLDKMTPGRQQTVIGFLQREKTLQNILRIIKSKQFVEGLYTTDKER
jgi:hypothetical protein